MAAKIKKGDKVIILTGKDRGRTGEVVKAIPTENRVVVSGINIATRHVKPSNADPQGGIKRTEAAIHVSNVAIVDPTSGKPTRVGFKNDSKGRKVRYAKKSGEQIDA